VKICILNVFHDAFDKRMFHKVGRSLVTAGHLVVSICPEGEFSGNKRDGIYFRYVPGGMSLRQRLCSVWHLFQAGRKEEADIYLVPEPESWVAALLIKLFQGGRVVFDMHEHAATKFARYFPSPMRPFMVALTRWVMRRFAGYTDHIILTRESFDPEWEGLPTPRTVVINSNHLQPRCTNIPDAVTRQLGSGPIVLHQGVFGDIRGSWQLLDAMKSVVRAIPEARCLILGDYVYGDLAKYQQAVKDAGLEETFLFIDTVAYEDVPAYVAASDVGLILFQPGRVNHILAMPHKLFDYMREAKPVVAPDFAIEVAHILDESDGGVLVEVTDPEAIARAIIRLLEDRELAQRLGANGRKAIEEHYHWAIEEVKLLAAIESLREA
jgi:glycosyltransferase involved in cell wall biosynthesis